MTRETDRRVFRISAALSIVAVVVFVVLSVFLAPTPASANGGGGCTPGECQKNGCTEKAQYCNATGDGWLVCGTC